MIKLLTIGDPHFSGKGPDAYLPNPAAYKNDGLSILAECAELARIHNCAAVLIPGDFTHSHIMSTAVQRELVEALRKFHCPVLTIPGNHDRESTNLEDLKAAPYGLIEAANIIHDVFNGPYTLSHYGVAITGHPYDENTDKDMSQYFILERLGKVAIHMTHGMLLPDHPWWITEKENKTDREGRRHYYTTFEDLAKLAETSPDTLPNIIVNGHLHDGHEPTYLPNGTLIVNFGAVCRLTRDLSEINRTLKVGLITIEESGNAGGKCNYKAEPIILKSQRPGVECLNREELVREIERKKNKEKMSEYLQLLGTKREIRVRDARAVIKDAVRELSDSGTISGIAPDFLEKRCLERLDRVSGNLEAREVGM